MLYNDALDDPLLDAGTLGFAGVREAIAPALLGDADLYRAQDVVIDTSGTVETRPGTDWVAQPESAAVQGMWFYDIPGFERLLVVTNGKMYHLSSVAVNSTATEITGFSPALSTSNRVTFCQLVDKVYLSDGANYYEVYWNGLTWSVANQATFSGGSTLADFTILLVARAQGAAFRVLGSGINTTDNDLLYVTATLNGMSWNSAHNVRVGRGDGDPILAVLSDQDGRLTVCKEKSFWYVNPTSADLADWTMGAINEKVGALAGRTCQQVGQDVFALTEKGVISLGRLTNQDSVNEAAIISTDIKVTLARLNRTAASTSWATVWGDYYLLAVPLDSATTPNAVLAFNVVTQRWSGHWTGLAPRCAEQSRFSSAAETILGDSSGRLLRLSSTTRTDQTALATFAQIPALIETKAWNFALPRHPKQLFTVEVQFESSTGNVNVELIGDGRSAVTIEAAARTNQLPVLPVVLPFSLNADDHLRRGWHLRNQKPAREVRLRLTATTGYLKVREIKFQGWPDTPKVIL